MSSSTPPDYSFWTLVVSAITLIVLGLSVLAQYLGLFGGKLKVPIGKKIIVYQNNNEILGGIVVSRNSESITLKKVYHIEEIYTIGSAEPRYMNSKHIAEADIPIPSILRWKAFPSDLAKLWDTLP